MGSSRATPLHRLGRKAPPSLLRAIRKPPPTLLRATRKRPASRPGRPSWKLVGLAGVAGVAATGVVVARKRRAHRDLPADELRERLHKRLAEVDAAPAVATPTPPA